LLKRQLEVNAIQHVDVVIAAVSDQVGRAEFSDDTVSVMASLLEVRSNQQSRFKIWVDTTTIDHELLTRPPPDVLKIDVEGAELRVLKGAERLLRQKRPILLVELHSPEIAAKYDQRMADIGYQTWSLEGRRISASESGERFVVSRPN